MHASRTCRHAVHVCPLGILPTCMQPTTSCQAFVPGPCLPHGLQDGPGGGREVPFKGLKARHVDGILASRPVACESCAEEQLRVAKTSAVRMVIVPQTSRCIKKNQYILGIVHAVVTGFHAYSLSKRS